MVTGEAVSTEGLPGGPRLLGWFAVLMTVGIASLLLGLQESALLVALAGLYVAAQAADLYPPQRQLYWALTWIIPVGGAVLFSVLAWVIAEGEPGPLRIPFAGVAAASAVLCLLTIFRPFSDRLTRTLFRGHEPTHALRLTARLVLMGLLLALPGWYAFRDSLEELLTDETLLSEGALGTGLMGYVILAFASVGFMVRRDLGQALDRLGLRPLKPGDFVITVAGVAFLVGLNLGLETVQRTWFPDLWASDQRATELIGRNLGTVQIVLLGLSAGVGEEITLRGALQPRLGVVMTSLLFAALHVQYSWFGMGVIFTFGIVLGVIRLRYGTAVAIAIHTLYDMVAIFAT
jgi:hypothetical protein